MLRKRTGNEREEAGMKGGKWGLYDEVYETGKGGKGRTGRAT